jgi:hypothetical protein
VPHLIMADDTHRVLPHKRITKDNRLPEFQTSPFLTIDPRGKSVTEGVNHGVADPPSHPASNAVTARLATPKGAGGESSWG